MAAGTIGMTSSTAGAASSTGMGLQMGQAAATAAAANVGGGIGDTVGYMLGELTGTNAHRSKAQLEQQKKLNALQEQSNIRQADYTQGLNKDYFDYTAEYNKAANQVSRLKEAGLNPALMYGMQGAAGSTGASGGGKAEGVGGAHASSESERLMADTARQGMGLQAMKTAAEIKVMESQAEKNLADASLSGAKTDTEDKQRDFLIGKLREEGVYYWIQNEINELKLGGDSTDIEVIKNKFLDRVIGKDSNSWAKQEITNALLKTVAETGNLDASRLLSNERAKAIWNELLIAQQNADSNTVKAKASELAVNWGTGEYKNWKTWVDLGANALKTITSIIK